MEISRESIFIAALRSFCKAFFTIVGILVGIVLIGIIFAVMSGPVNLPAKSTISISADSNGDRTLLPDSSPVILRINIHGVIGTRDLTAGHIEDLLLDSQSGLIKTDRIKGLLLHMQTPGGVAIDSDTIYRHLKAYKEKYRLPLYAYVDGICASGGMYIAAAADKIYSSPTGMIGSIGVRLGPLFNFAEIMAKLGVKSLTLTEGKDKDMLNPFRPWATGEEISLKNIMAYDYNRFVDIITLNRARVSKDKLINVYGAQIFSPPEAESIGYIDMANSSYNQTLIALTDHAGIGKEEKYQVIELQSRKPIFADLIEGKSLLLSGKVKHIVELTPELDPDLMNKVLYLYQP